MPFLCGAKNYVPIDPPGDLGSHSVTSVERVEDREDGLRVVVSGEQNGKPVVVSLLFQYVWAYCVSSESLRLTTASQLVAANGSSTLLQRVAGSEWIDRFVEESGGIVEKSDVEHYLVVTGDEWVDVIGQSPPQVEFL